MGKWTERLVIAIVAMMVVVACIGMYSTWSDCKAQGGTTVRGLFGLECIK
jgi:hypothetical protein